MGPLERANLSHWFFPSSGEVRETPTLMSLDKVQKPSDAECYARSPEPFRFYLNGCFVTGKIISYL
jgi:hypothetical protein